MVLKRDLWPKTVLPLTASIRSAIRVLDSWGLQIVLVVNSEGQLIGTVSDGDIRRGLLESTDLDLSLKTVTNFNPISVKMSESLSCVRKLMIQHGIQQIPVTDDKNSIVGLHLWADLFSERKLENPIVIMAGGKGSRLYPKTQNLPKPMLEVKGKPILLRIIEQAKDQGFLDFYIAIHYLGEMIEDYFGNGEKFGVNITYLREENPLGTAGALSLLVPLPASAIVVTNGDLLTDIDYGDIINFHLANGAHATMAVRPYEMQNQFGVVRMNGIEICEYEEKPIYRSHINAGVYVINPDAIPKQANVAFDMPSLFETLRNNGKKVVAFPMYESWIDIGSIQDYQSANSSNSQIAKGS